MSPTRGEAEAFGVTTPRAIHRHRPGVYSLVRLADLHWIAAHTDERQYMNLSARGPFLTQKRKVKVSDTVRIAPPGRGTLATVHPDRLPDYVRRPSAKALERIEVAEAAVRTAQEELAAAKKAAFAYGRPIPISAVKRVDRERRRAIGS